MSFLVDFTNPIEPNSLKLLQAFFKEKVDNNQWVIYPNTPYDFPDTEQPVEFAQALLIRPKTKLTRQSTTRECAIEILDDEPLSETTSSAIFDVIKTLRLTISDQEIQLGETKNKPRMVKFTDEASLNHRKKIYPTEGAPYAFFRSHNEARIHHALKKPGSKHLIQDGDQSFLIMRKSHPNLMGLSEFCEEQLAELTYRDRLRLCLKILLAFKKITPIILHRDLTLNSFMIDPETLAVQITQFEHAILKTESADRTGTYGYIAPEIYDDEPYSSASDTFSLGRIMTILLGGPKPQAFVTPQERFVTPKLKEIERREQLTSSEADAKTVSQNSFFKLSDGRDNIKQILQGMLSPKPDDRPNLGKIEMDFIIELVIEAAKIKGQEQETRDCAATSNRSSSQGLTRTPSPNPTDDPYPPPGQLGVSLGL